jgi:alkanesulfonate monooxygenase SsuD/methylene tetrahydromethanopterin reductase-like flavin-dependent oxidoreductase (luciferase family)
MSTGLAGRPLAQKLFATRADFARSEMNQRRQGRAGIPTVRRLKMDFGIFYEIQVNSPLKYREREYQAFHDVMNQVVFAEQCGFTNFWTVEHHFQVGFAHSSAPEVLYGAISQRTSVIRIGHAVVLLPYPYNHPIRVAERVATLDILSNGRVEVGTGRSATQVELGGFGIPYRETRARWEEALDVITTIWKSKDGTFSYKGKYFDIPERTVVPMPIQKPHPPMWVACTGEDTHELAGKLGLGLLSFTLLVAPEKLGRRVESYRNAIKTAKPYGAFVNNKAGAFSMVHLADTDKQAREEAERSFMSYVNTTLRVNSAVIEAKKTGVDPKESPRSLVPDLPKQYEGLDPSKVTIDSLIEHGMCICGSPDSAIRQLERLQQAAHLDQFLAMMQFWAIPHEKTMHAIDLFGKYVIPHFRENGRTATAAAGGGA